MLCAVCSTYAMQTCITLLEDPVTSPLYSSVQADIGLPDQLWQYIPSDILPYSSQTSIGSVTSGVDVL